MCYLVLQVKKSTFSVSVKIVSHTDAISCQAVSRTKTSQVCLVIDLLNNIINKMFLLLGRCVKFRNQLRKV